MRGGREKAIAGLDECERMAFGVFESETRPAHFVFGGGAGFDFVREKEFAHLREIRSGEGDFGEEIVGSAARNLLEFDPLAAIDGVAGISGAEASGGGGIKAKNLGIEGAGGVEVGGVEADGNDAGDFGAGLCCSIGSFLNTKD